MLLPKNRGWGMMRSEDELGKMERGEDVGDAKRAPASTTSRTLVLRKALFPFFYRADEIDEHHTVFS